jgi:hypothetical protein
VPFVVHALRSQVKAPEGTNRLSIQKDIADVYLHLVDVLWYTGTMMDESKLLIERVQTGVRMEKRLLKVLKGFAEYHDMSLGDLLEGIVLHAFDGKTPFNAESLKRIQDLKRFYALDLDSSASHRLKEIKQRSGNKTASEKKK